MFKKENALVSTGKQCCKDGWTWVNQALVTSPLGWIFILLHNILTWVRPFLSFQWFSGLSSSLVHRKFWFWSICLASSLQSLVWFVYCVKSPISDTKEQGNFLKTFFFPLHWKKIRSPAWGPVGSMRDLLFNRFLDRCLAKWDFLLFTSHFYSLSGTASSMKPPLRNTRIVC